LKQKSGPLSERIAREKAFASNIFAMSNLITRVVRVFLPAAAVGTVALLVVYGAVQQQYRQSANDPQVQLAEDTAVLLEGGSAPNAVLPLGAKVDAAKSLAVGILVTDADGVARISSFQPTAGAELVPPKGVLEAAKNSGTPHTFTWSPAKGVRLAAVSAYYGGATPGYVVVARSLRLVEDRIGQLGLFVGMAWVILMVILLGVSLLVSKRETRG